MLETNHDALNVLDWFYSRTRNIHTKWIRTPVISSWRQLLLALEISDSVIIYVLREFKDEHGLFLKSMATDV